MSEPTTDANFLQCLDQLLHDEVGPWLDAIKREAGGDGLRILGSWPLPAPYEDVAWVAAKVDGDQVRITIGLKRTGQVIATTTTTAR
jgi:hypothetical protein